MSHDPYYKNDGITLYHGDCREETSWLTADVLVTDPPYGIAWPSGAMQAKYVKGKPAPVVDAVRGDRDSQLRDTAIRMWGTRPAVVFGTWRVSRPPGVQHRLIWHKKRAAPGMLRAPFYSAEEEIYILGKGFLGDPVQNVIVTAEWRTGEGALGRRIGHPTPKPVPLMQILIGKCPLGIVADPFAGSGSTLVAARLEGREAIGVEIEERYCEIAARRLDQGVLEFPA